MAEATNRGCLYAFTLWDFVSSGSPSRPLTMQGMTEYEMNLFGKKKVAPTVSLQDAIKSLKSATEACLKREVYLDREKEAARIEGAKKLKAKDKNGAMFYLKRMRALEKELNMLYGKRHNLDTLVMSLESASFDKTLVSAMASAHEASKTLIKDSDVDKVQDMVADLQESMRNVEDIGNALAEPISTEVIDEDELLTAFEEQHEHEVEEVATDISMPDIHNLPAAPTTVPNIPARPATVLAGGPGASTSTSTSTSAASNSKEEDEYKRLEALMNI